MDTKDTTWAKARKNVHRPYFGSRRIAAFADKHLSTHPLTSPEQPLKSAKNIRLLQLFPNFEKSSSTEERRSRVRVEVIEVSIEDPPDYYALSYTWGDDSITRTIICSGKPLQVTRNLEEALAGIFESNYHDAELSVATVGCLNVWADSICINQADMEEKRSQLLMMPRIYNQSTRVVVFLSEMSGSRRVKGALDHVGDLARMERVIHEGVHEKIDKGDKTHHGHSLWRLPPRHAPPEAAVAFSLAMEVVRYARTFASDVMADHAQKAAPEADGGHRITKKHLQQFGIQHINYHLLDDIFQSPWFGRSWINQEIAYAYTADFHIGKYRMNWDAMRRLAIVLTD